MLHSFMGTDKKTSVIKEFYAMREDACRFPCALDLSPEQRSKMLHLTITAHAYPGWFLPDEGDHRDLYWVGELWKLRGFLGESGWLFTFNVIKKTFRRVVTNMCIWFTCLCSRRKNIDSWERKHYSGYMYHKLGLLGPINWKIVYISEDNL